MNVPWEERLAETFVRLADTLVGGFDLSEFLHLLAHRGRQLLNVAAVEVMVADPHGVLHRAGNHADGFPAGMACAELTDGPGPECLRTGRVVAMADLASAVRRWPRFVQVADRSGYRSAHALPMRLRDDVIGAVTLLDHRPAALPETRLRLAQSLVDVATIGILHQRDVVQHRRLAGQLHTALTSRVPIEQAKGVLSERFGVSTDDAFTMLRRHARNHNRRLAELARRVVDGAENIPEDGPHPPMTGATEQPTSRRPGTSDSEGPCRAGPGATR